MRNLKHLAEKLDLTVASMERRNDRMFVAGLRDLAHNTGVDPPPVPERISEILSLLDRPGTSLADLARIIERDAEIAARFLAVANAPAYARRGRIRSVEVGVVRLGLLQTSFIIMALLSRSNIFRMPGRREESAALHRHAVATAVTAQQITRLRDLDLDDAFMAGLLHDAGRTITYAALDRFHAESAGKNMPAEDVVASVIDDAHAGFSALFVRSWKFPPLVAEAIAAHHDPSAVSSRDRRDLAEVIHAADLIAHWIEVGPPEEESAAPEDPESPEDTTEPEPPPDVVASLPPGAPGTFLLELKELCARFHGPLDAGA